MTGEQAAVNLFSYCLQIGVLVGVCAGIPRLLRVSAPGIQYAFWRALLLACLLLPLLQTWRPSGPGHRAGTASTAHDVQNDAASVVFVFPSAGEHSRNWAFALLAVLVTGSVCRLAWVGAGIVRLRRRSPAETDANREFGDLQHSLGTDASIRWSHDARQPVTFGLFHPVVLLPVSLRALEPRALRAVVAHELFHVRRATGRGWWARNACARCSGSIPPCGGSSRACTSRAKRWSTNCRSCSPTRGGPTSTRCSRWRMVPPCPHLTPSLVVVISSIA